MEQKASILIYQTEDGTAMTEVRLAAETVWLRQEQMAQLFGRERSVIGKHLHNVFAEGELDEKSNVQNLHIAGSDKPVRFYNLDVIISIGYRVKSQQGTRFRQWATRTLREHLTQGYTLNDPPDHEHAGAHCFRAASLIRPPHSAGSLASCANARITSRTTRFCGAGRARKASKISRS